MISSFNLFRELRQQRKTAAKRHPMYDQNKFAKYFMGFAVALWLVYLVMFGFLFIGLFSGIFPSMEPYHILNKGMLYLLVGSDEIFIRSVATRNGGKRKYNCDGLVALAPFLEFTR